MEPLELLELVELVELIELVELVELVELLLCCTVLSIHHYTIYRTPYNTVQYIIHTYIHTYCTVLYYTVPTYRPTVHPVPERSSSPLPAPRVKNVTDARLTRHVDDQIKSRSESSALS